VHTHSCLCLFVCVCVCLDMRAHTLMSVVCFCAVTQELKLKKKKMVDLLTEGEEGISIMEYLKVGRASLAHCAYYTPKPVL